MGGSPVDQLLVRVDDTVIADLGGEVIKGVVDHLLDGAFALTGQGVEVGLLCLGVDGILQGLRQLSLGNLGLVSQSSQTVNGDINTVGGDGAVGLALGDQDVGNLLSQIQQSAIDLDAGQDVGLAASGDEVVNATGQGGQFGFQSVVALHLLSQSLEGCQFYQMGVVVSHCVFLLMMIKNICSPQHQFPVAPELNTSLNISATSSSVAGVPPRGSSSPAAFLI